MSSQPEPSPQHAATPEEERADPVAYQLLVPLMLIALLNGMHSPFTALLVKMAGGWYPPFLPPLPELVFYLAQIFTATLTLIVAGIPAALYERLMGTKRTTYVSMGIWLLGAAVLSLPAIGVVRQLL